MLFWTYEKEKFHQNYKETNNYRFGVKTLIMGKRENIKTIIYAIAMMSARREIIKLAKYKKLIIIKKIVS